MKIRFTRNTGSYTKGDTTTVNEGVAAHLINAGAAEANNDSTPARPQQTPANVNGPPVTSTTAKTAGLTLNDISNILNTNDDPITRWADVDTLDTDSTDMINDHINRLDA